MLLMFLMLVSGYNLLWEFVDGTLIYSFLFASLDGGSVG